ncbi:MAG TPA: DNA-processing protein DprA [Dietzia timorensis]|uniref:DNA-processing protein DprA n=1 Tax=Dietzia timorensis TaxID=499555 RepID=A0A921F650_9ACTN|nr:DNA-processing protein DprA [Dietzia timorensis]HJE91980.1 DNA-processing protein DprA [Dietzia timorensis]
MRPITETGDAWLYLNAVCERPTAAMWDFVDAFGPIEAAERIKANDTENFRDVAAQTAARAGKVDPTALRALGEQYDARFLCPANPDWPAEAFSALDHPRQYGLDHSGVEAGAALPLAPFGLWVRGGPDLPNFAAARTASIVGTRDLTSYGRVVASELAEACAGEDIAVISGGALGVDIAAHLGALSADGITTAVLACGVDKLYPSANEQSLRRVAASGGAISEYPPGTGVTRYRFLDRNRIIAALGSVTVVVEAAMRSGALSTARWANAMNRSVFAVPGPIHSRASAGCNNLLGMYALPLASTSEIGEVVSTLGFERSAEPNPYDVGAGKFTRRPGSPADWMTEEQSRVFEALRGDCMQDSTKIAWESGVPESRVKRHLGTLKRFGFAVKTGGRWQLPTRRDQHQQSLPLNENGSLF